MVRFWRPTSRGPSARGFTLAETLVVIALMVITAGLATQLLFTSLVFAETHGTGQKQFRILLALKTGVLTTCALIQPPAWADPETVVRLDGDRMILKYWTGKAESEARVSVDASGVLRWETEGEVRSWGPWKGLSIAVWRVEDRAVGLKVTLPSSAGDRVLSFPWKTWPL